MNLNNALPKYDFAEKHKVVINSSPEKVFNAIINLDMSKSKVINRLLNIRFIFGSLSRNEKSRKEPVPGLTFKDMNKKFILVEEVRNQEIVLGLAGKFWQPSSGLVKMSTPEEFINFNQTGYCKVAWNLYIERNNGVTLSTETRVLCLGWRAKLFFLFYWAIIRPFSGWIRLEMLKMIKEQVSLENKK